MSTKAYELTQILETLTEEDYRAAIKYAEFLAASRKKTYGQPSKEYKNY